MNYEKMLDVILLNLQDKLLELKSKIIDFKNDSEMQDILHDRIQNINEARETLYQLIDNVKIVAEYTTLDYYLEDRGDKPTLINNIDAPIEDFEKVQDLLSKTHPEHEIKK